MCIFIICTDLRGNSEQRSNELDDLGHLQRGSVPGKNTLVISSTHISLQRTPIRWFSELLRSLDRLSSSWYLEFCSFSVSS